MCTILAEGDRTAKGFMPISKDRLAEIDAIDDGEIDTSDIPGMGEDFFAAAKLVLPPGTSPEAVLRAYGLGRRGG